MRASHSASNRGLNSQAGLSLIELMIALVVGLILVAGVIAVFISGKQGYGTNTAVAQIQDNGRFALDYIRNDVRMTGYMGCTTTARTNVILNPVGQLYNFSLPMYGFEYNGTDPSTATSGAPYVITLENPTPTALSGGNWTPAADGTLPVNAIPGSDALLLFTATGDPVYVTAPTGGGSIPVNSITGFTANQLAVITDCLRSTVFQMSAATSGTPDTITVGSGAAPGPGNSQTSFNVGYQDGAQVLSADAILYYIGKGQDGAPALYRVDVLPNGALNPTPAELVPGVENMQILYGVDPSGQLGTPSAYMDAATVNTKNYWTDVLSVQIGLLIRSGLGAVPLPKSAQTYDVLGTYITAPIDTRLRRVFTATIYLRNAPLPTD